MVKNHHDIIDIREVMKDKTGAVCKRRNTPNAGIMMKDPSRPASTDFRFTFARTRWYVIILILCAEAAERLSFYTMSSTYKKVMTTTFGYDYASASTNWSAVVQLGFLSPIVFGVIADSYLGNYWTSLITFTSYMIGKLLMAVALAPEYLNEALFLAGAFVFLSIGVGMKATMMTYGADQLQQEEGETEMDYEGRRTRYFHWYYAALEVGAFVSQGFLTTIATTGQFQGLEVVTPERAMFFTYWLGFGVLSFGFLAFAVTYFWAVPDSRTTHSHRGPRLSDGGVIGENRKTLGRQQRALERGNMQSGSRQQKIASGNGLVRLIHSIWHEKRGKMGKIALFAWCLFIFTTLWSIVLNIVGTKSTGWLSYLTLAFYVLMNGLLAYVYANTSWIQDPEVAKFLQVIPVSFLAYGTLNIAKYNDPAASACQADIRLFDSTQNNAAELGMTQAVAVWICTLLMNLVVFPLCHRKGWTFSIKHRLLLAGLLLAAVGASMSILESIRKTTPFVEPLEISNCAYVSKAAGDVYIRSLSGWWYVIPYMLLGFGESLLYAAVGEYVYATAPPSFASTAIGIWQMAYSLQPAIIHSVLQLLTQKWVIASGSDFDKNHLENVYALNAAVALIGLIIFLFLPIPQPKPERIGLRADN